jgi:hypothetical protein
MIFTSTPPSICTSLTIFLTIKINIIAIWLSIIMCHVTKKVVIIKLTESSKLEAIIGF